MTSNATRTAVVALLLAVVPGLVSCSEEPADGAVRAPAATSSAPEPDRARERERELEPTTQATPDDVVVVDIVIADGAVTPTGRQVDVTVGQDVRLQVDSDAPDELHVHSAPEEQTFEVAVAAGQTFEFTTEQPGQFDVELHESGTLVAQLVVQP